MGAFISPLIQYGVFFIFLTLAFRETFFGLWSEDERIHIRDRFNRTIKTQQMKMKESRDDSGLDNLFRETEIRWLTATRFFWIQISIILIGFICLLIAKNMVTAFIFALSFYIISQPSLNYSPFRLFLNHRIKNVRMKKEFELFTLFDIIKSDLITSTSEQVNIYHLLNESLPYFKSIDYTITRFLSLWRRSPIEAGRVFEEDLGGDTAIFLGDVFSRMHTLSRKDALHLLSEQNDLFRFRISEMALQKAEIQRNVYYILFFSSSILSIVWFMYYVFMVTIRSLNM